MTSKAPALVVLGTAMVLSVFAAGPPPAERPPRVVAGEAEVVSVAPVPPRTVERSAPATLWPFGVRPPFGGLSPLEREDRDAIFVGNASFLAKAGPPRVPAELEDLRGVGEAGGYFVVSVRGALSATAIEELEERGIRVLRSVPRSAYLVRLERSGQAGEAQLAALREIAGAEAIFRYQPAWKISPRIGSVPLSAATARAREAGRLPLRVVLFPGEDPSPVAEAAKDGGAAILSLDRGEAKERGLLPDGRVRAIRAPGIEVEVTIARAASLLGLLARLEAVRWIEEIGEYGAASDWTVSGWDYGDSRSAGADFLAVRQPWNNGVHGEGVLIGVVDSGLDFDHAFFATPVRPWLEPEDPPQQACPGTGPKNSAKVPVYHLGPASGSLVPACYDQPSGSSNPSLLGHGTCTSGLMAADATASSAAAIHLSSGTAPEAQIWMYDVGPSSGNQFALVPASLADEIDRMGEAGASVLNLSFGNGGTNGDYDVLAELLDAAAWNRPALLPVQAAGNDGANSGSGNLQSVDATGKNVLAVGGNLDNSPNDLYGFSARGPTADGRIKPEIVSPATNALRIANADPDLDERFLLVASDGNIASHNNALIEGPEGTSFSCASVSGLAAVTAQYFRDGFHPRGIATPADAVVPGSDLLRAVLVNSGLRMTGTGIAGAARPGKDQGWGRPKVSAPLYFSADPATGDDPRKLLVHRGSFAQGATSCPADSEIFRFELFNVEEEVRVTLAWTDFPGDAGSPTAPQLVNDLDLKVTSPGGTVYRGNVFDATGSGFSATGGTADRLNNLENVWLPAEGASTGVWTVEVCPYAIPDGGRQSFSLVVTGGVRDGVKVQLDQVAYTCSDAVGVTVTDLVAWGPTVPVTLTSAPAGDAETIALPAAGPTGTFAAFVPTATGAAVPGDGILQVTDGGTISAVYGSSTDAASVECTPAICYASELGPTLLHECDGDGYADNGEEIHLYLPLRNLDRLPLDGARVQLVSTSPNVQVLSGEATYGTVAPGEVALPDADGTDDPFVLLVAGGGCNETVNLTVTVVHGTGWTGAACPETTVSLTLNRDPVPMRTFDFDDGSAQGWTHVVAHGSTPAIECDETYYDVWGTFPVTARSHSGAYSMRLGNGGYPTMVDAALVSPLLEIPSGGARMRFRYWMAADVYNASQVWHGFVVEARLLPDGPWNLLTPTGGYNATAARNDCNYSFPFGNTRPNWLRLFGGDGDGSLYTGDRFDREWAVDLAAYASQAIQVRFRFGSDDYPSPAEGLYVDTVVVDGIECETAEVCDDRNPCTDETCDPDLGGCLVTPRPNGSPCDDGEPCTASEACAAGACTGSPVLNCDDGNPCTDDRARDDGDGTCNNPVGDCEHTNNTLPCSDGNACTTDDACDGAGSCLGGPPPTCDDHNPCTDDSCVPATGCRFDNHTRACDDGFSCTAGDACSGGACAGTPNHALCDDQNVCTSDTCSPANPAHGYDGCIHPPMPNGTACDDATVCTVTQSCQAGQCTGTQTLNCSDGAACTHDLCDPVTGCANPGIDQDEDEFDICGPEDPANPDGRARDCNDVNPSIYPGAVEDCFNNQDDDCDGLVDAADAGSCPRSDISGTVIYYRTSAGVEPGTARVRNAEMRLIGTATATKMTDASGAYQFLDIVKGLLAVVPRKVGDFYAAISSFDAARISQYRVGMYAMTPNQIVAADVSGNGSVSSYDAALVSQLRVGMITRFPVAIARDSDWAFVPSQRDYAPLETDQTNQDFLAIAYGDVSGNWGATEGPAEGAPLEARALEADPAPEARPTPPAAPAEACALSLLPASSRGLPPRHRRYVLEADGCEGVVALDVDLRYPAGSASLVSVSRGAGLTASELTAKGSPGLVRISLFGAERIPARGDLVEFVLLQESAFKTSAMSLHALADEGQVAVTAFPPGRNRPRRP